jgi:hypothetical protein
MDRREDAVPCLKLGAGGVWDGELGMGYGVWGPQRDGEMGKWLMARRRRNRLGVFAEDG